MSTWSFVGNDIYRYGTKVASIINEHDGLLSWEGMGIRRTGFTSTERVLDDVQYFYRYGARQTTVTFQSGRKVAL